MYRILVPLDNSSDRASKQTAFVSSLLEARPSVEVVLAHTFTDEERTVPRDMKRADRVETVRRSKERLEAADVEVDFRDLESPPAEGIVSLVEDEGFDLIVMGGRKRTPIENAILGSTTQRVLRNVEVPVTITGGE
ncbi:MAG: universal stress protein [Halanaeroarchaeum sp.]